MARNPRIRFLDNNLLADTSITITNSGVSNISRWTDETRYLKGEFDSYFEITASNDTLRFDESGTKDVTIAAGNYSGTALASALQTECNNVLTATTTVTYDTATKKFTFSFSSSVTFKGSDAASNMRTTIGLNTGDQTGTSLVSAIPVAHTSVWLHLDLGVPKELSAIVGLAPANETLKLSPSATVTIKGNNINDFTSPAYSATITDITDRGMYFFLDAQAEDLYYRYWKLEIVDANNANAPAFGELYMGDYLTITQRNLSRGFQKKYEDASLVTQSEAGVTYSQERYKEFKLSDAGIQYLEAGERRDLEQFFYNQGKSVPFFISLDPTNECTTSLEELTKFVRFDNMPNITHVKSDVYTVSFSVTEAI